jgi:ribosomal protein L11 methyltransferase
MLGAWKCVGADFDPHAVRTAKENVRANAASGVAMKKLDVRNWTPERTWNIVAANLFSGLLVEVAQKLATATASGGRLIFSGILRTQEAEVLAAFRRAGFRINRIVRKGKWIAGLASRRESFAERTRGKNSLTRFASRR